MQTRPLRVNPLYIEAHLFSISIQEWLVFKQHENIRKLSIQFSTISAGFVHLQES